MTKLAKLFTKPVWWWQRHRPYPIRQQIWRLPPQQWCRSSTTSVTVLTTPANVCNAAWTAYSVGLALRDLCSLTITIDGRWEATTSARLHRLFPEITLRETAAEVEACAASVPILRGWAAQHPMGRKIAAVAAQQIRGATVFTDDDVLAFGTLPEIRAAVVDGGSTVRYLREQGDIAQEDANMLRAARQLGLAAIPDINVGLLFLPPQVINLPLAQQILALAEPSDSWFPDTTLLSVLLNQVPHKRLPESYLVSTAGQFYCEARPDISNLEARHYVGPVRHLMYREGMPHVLAKIAKT